MGFMDLLKTPDQQQTISQDGKTYQFIPGQNGSLTVQGKAAQKPLLPPLDRTAKTVTPPKVASTRG